MKRSKALLLLLLVSVGAIFISSTVVKNEIEFENKTVSVFKDGSGFFVKEAHLEDNEKKRLYFTDNLPKATFSTFWFFSDAGNLAGVSSFADTVHTFEMKKRPIVNLRSLLKKNVSKRVEIICSRNQPDVDGVPTRVERTVTGKLVWFEADLVTVETNGIFETFPFLEVANIKFKTSPVYESDEEVESVAYKPVLQIDFHKKMDEDRLELMYLTKGITWIPGYYIELQKKGRAKVILRSTLINDAEDIENSDVNFVVGVPNFQYANELSPIFGSKQVAKFLGELDVNYQPLETMNLNNFSNSIRSYNVDPNIHLNNTAPPVSTELQGGMPDEPDLSETIKSLTASSSQDMFFYTAKNVSLKKGGRGFYDIFEINVPVKHVYECALSTSGSANTTTRANYKFGKGTVHPVHHSLKLENSSQFPFTTGPALLVSTANGHLEPLSQDKIKYTPMGGSVSLKMTEAIDIFVAESETIKKVADKKKQYPKRTDNAPWYDLVTVKGKITMVNHKSESVELQVRKTVHGMVDIDKDYEESVISQEMPKQLNDLTKMKFNETLAPKEKRTIHYSYTTYIRH